MAREIILTGAPGAGKTLLLRSLEADGFDVVEESATDVIALAQGRDTPEPWTNTGFIGEIARLQLQRLARPSAATVRIHDRSLFCTLALAEYLGHPVPKVLTSAIDRVLADAVFARRVLFVELLGVMVNTAARRITLEDARRFEAFHVAAYERFGFELVRVPAAEIGERTAMVTSALERQMVNGS